MVRTQLDQLNDLISDIKDNLSKAKENLNSDRENKYLKEEVLRIQERLDWCINYRDQVISSGKTKYLYDFGTIDFFRQELEDVANIDNMFVYYTELILNRGETPAKKIKYMKNLLKTYNELKDQKD